MADVLHRTSKQFKRSVNTAVYPVGTWIHDPDFANVQGVAKKHWKITGDVISEMNQAEKDVVDVDPTLLADAKATKFAAINANTRTLIAQGFAYEAKTFSLSAEAQRNWWSYRNATELSFPLRINILDDSDAHDFANYAAIEDARAIAISTRDGHLASGTALKDLVRAETTVSGVEAIEDNR